MGKGLNSRYTGSVGHKVPGGVKFATIMPDSIFDKLNEFAMRNDISVAASVRLLLSQALSELEDQ